MHSLLVNELGVDPGRLVKVLHFDGTPITARFITKAIMQQVHAEVVTPKKKSRKEAA
jgi:2-oxoglutarate ferredoxin oxidoreductase subunit alpha